MTSRTRAIVALGLGAALLAAAPAKAQDVKYPTKNVNFIVAFAAGGFADTLARFVAQKLTEKLGQTVVVENRGGAGGNLAARVVATGEADGHTILVTTTAAAINPTMYRKLDFSPDALVPVAIPASSPETIASHPGKPFKTLKEFIAWAKDKEVNFATAGVGSGSHLAAEYFLKEHAKLKAVHVPFRGGALAVQAVLGDQVELVASSFGVTSQVVEKKLIGLAVASPKRNPAMPDVPTYTESGYPFEAESWVGFYVSSKTNPAIVAKLNAAINEAVSEKAANDYLSKIGFSVTPRNVAESAAYHKSEVEKWGTMVKTLGVYVD